MCFLFFFFLKNFIYTYYKKSFFDKVSNPAVSLHKTPLLSLLDNAVSHCSFWTANHCLGKSVLSLCPVLSSLILRFSVQDYS